jgi:hypothetical protein
MTKQIASTCVLALGILAFAGSALAGNGNGNGNGNGGGNPSQSDAAPGNSGNAPGQEKKDVAPEPAQSTSTTTTTTATTTTVAEPSSAPTTGVKPSNTTAHDTHAAASSNQTKKYGNGQTAGAIAQKNGASGNTILHGPGNSQPHKATPCSGGHEVDVHALKSHSHSRSCGTPTPNPTPDPSPTPAPTPPPGHTATTSERQPPARPGSDPGSAPAGSKTTGHEESSSASDRESQGVLAATGRIGRAATLPFTGTPLWFAVLLGLLLIGAGLGLRQIRTPEAYVESGHDHANRARDSAGRSGPSIRGRASR